MWCTLGLWGVPQLIDVPEIRLKTRRPLKVKTPKFKPDMAMGNMDCMVTRMRIDTKIIFWALKDVSTGKEISKHRWENFLRKRVHTNSESVETNMASIESKMQVMYVATGAFIGDQFINHSYLLWATLQGSWRTNMEWWTDEWWTEMWFNKWAKATKIECNRQPRIRVPTDITEQLDKQLMDVGNLRKIYDWMMLLNYATKFEEARKKHDPAKAIGKIEISWTYLWFMVQLSLLFHKKNLCSRIDVEKSRTVDFGPKVVQVMQNVLANNQGLPAKILYNTDEIKGIDVNAAIDVTMAMNKLCSNQDTQTVVMMHIMGFHLVFMSCFEILPAVLRGDFFWDFSNYHLGVKHLFSAWRQITYMHHYQLSQEDTEVPMGKSEWKALKSEGMEDSFEPQYDYTAAPPKLKLKEKQHQMNCLLAHAIAGGSIIREDRMFKEIICLSVPNNCWTYPRSCALMQFSHSFFERSHPEILYGQTPPKNSFKKSCRKLHLGTTSSLCVPELDFVLNIEQDSGSKNKRWQMMDLILEQLKFPWHEKDNQDRWHSWDVNFTRTTFWKDAECYFDPWPNPSAAGRMEIFTDRSVSYGSCFRSTHEMMHKVVTGKMYQIVLEVAPKYEVMRMDPWLVSLAPDLADFDSDPGAIDSEENVPAYEAPSVTANTNNNNNSSKSSSSKSGNKNNNKDIDMCVQNATLMGTDDGCITTVKTDLHTVPDEPVFDLGDLSPMSHDYSRRSNRRKNTPPKAKPLNIVDYGAGWMDDRFKRPPMPEALSKMSGSAVTAKSKGPDVNPNNTCSFMGTSMCSVSVNNDPGESSGIPEAFASDLDVQQRSGLQESTPSNKNTNKSKQSKKRSGQSNKSQKTDSNSKKRKGKNKQKLPTAQERELQAAKEKVEAQEKQLQELQRLRQQMTLLQKQNQHLQQQYQGHQGVVVKGRNQLGVGLGQYHPQARGIENERNRQKREQQQWWQDYTGKQASTNTLSGQKRVLNEMPESAAVTEAYRQQRQTHRGWNTQSGDGSGGRRRTLATNRNGQIRALNVLRHQREATQQQRYGQQGGAAQRTNVNMNVNTQQQIQTGQGNKGRYRYPMDGK